MEVEQTGPRPVIVAGASSLRQRRAWAVAAGIEVLLAVTAVLLDLLIPTLVLLVLTTVSLMVRRRGLGSLGLHRPPKPGRLVIEVLGLSIGWTLLTLAVLMPAAEHLTGRRRDVSQFAEVQGNVSLLLFLLLMSWTLAALGEEVAYRGYLQTRIRDILPAGRTGLVIAVLVSSVVFGLAHSEQGLVGIILTTVDAIFFSVLRYRYRTLWAAILAHGFNNSIGIIAYFIAGPFYGLW
jgi:membrane protease YdiL (CAAX protease family)